MLESDSSYLLQNWLQNYSKDKQKLKRHDDGLVSMTANVKSNKDIDNLVLHNKEEFMVNKEAANKNGCIKKTISNGEKRKLCEPSEDFTTSTSKKIKLSRGNHSLVTIAASAENCFTNSSNTEFQHMKLVSPSHLAWH